MADRLLICSRKGLFIAERKRGAWRLGEPAFLGEPVTMALSDRRDGLLYAALSHGHFGPKLHRSEDGGRSWAEIAMPALPPQPKSDDGKKAHSVSLIWCLEGGGYDRPGTLWAGTIPGALFRSDDRGDSWRLVDGLWNRPERAQWFGGGYDDPGIHSICVDPRDSSRVTVAVSCGGIWRSDDDGATWAAHCKGMFATYMPPEQREDPQFQDPHRMVQCPAQPETFWVQHHNGIFLSDNDLGQWREVTAIQPSTFGFAVAVHPEDAGTAWFAPAIKDELRLPVDGRFVIARARDGGERCEVLTRGLPSAPAYDLIYRHGLEVAEDGRTLAMGSTTGNLWTSDDGGDTWDLVSAHLPPVYGVRFA